MKEFPEINDEICQYGLPHHWKGIKLSMSEDLNHNGIGYRKDKCRRCERIREVEFEFDPEQDHNFNRKLE